MNTLKTYWLPFWQARNPREQHMLLVAAITLTAFIAYVALWHPLSNSQAHLREQLPRMQQDLVTLQQGITALKGQSGHSVADGDLRSTVQAQLDRYGVKADIHPLPQDQLKLEASRLPTDKALKLIAALEHGTGLHIAAAQMSGQNGEVQLTLTVSH